MNSALAQVDDLFAQKKLTKSARDNLRTTLMQDVFHGADANDGVAAAARMNLIVAGDGHTNIVAEDSLKASASVWSFDEPAYDVIMTNPPFGTSESSSLTASDLSRFPLPNGRGQHLFLQRMVFGVKPGGYICTVIDEGVLNTDSAADLRRWLLQQCELVAVVRLPDETFKPNKINVRASVLLMRRREHPDVDLEQAYPVTFCDLESLGYHGSGEVIRGFDFDRLRDGFENSVLDAGEPRSGEHWSAFDVDASLLAADQTCRMDFKYWEQDTRDQIEAMVTAGCPTIKDLNTIATARGKSPASETYVDEPDGFALIVKAGSNITKFGQLTREGADYVEKSVYDELPERAKVRTGDVLVSSTGDGTLGKVAVFDSGWPAAADGHVTIIRVDPNVIDPYYLCDYLRCGFGAQQIQRLYTGSTGLIELTPEHLDRVLVDVPGSIADQQMASKQLRESEASYVDTLIAAENELIEARSAFRG